MDTTRKLLLTAWFQATRPYRWWAGRAAAAAGRAPVMVLFYHRVADRAPNDWTISRQEFQRQLDWLQQEFDLITLQEAQRRLREGNTRPAVSITFDDGYADNIENAFPLLFERGIPSTYFVTLGNIVSGEPFPHDLAAGAPLAPNTLEELRDLADAGVEIGGHTRTHVDLSRVSDPAELFDEVIASTLELGDLLDRPIRYFAVPFGMAAQCRPAVFDLCRRHGLAGVCSAWGDYNWPGDDPFHLRRIHGDPHFIRLQNMLTIDPRKQWSSGPRPEAESAQPSQLLETSIAPGETERR